MAIGMTMMKAYSFVLACLFAPVAVQSDVSLPSSRSAVSGKDKGTTRSVQNKIARASLCKTTGTHRLCQVDVSSLHVEEFPESFDLDIRQDGQVLSCVRGLEAPIGNSWYVARFRSELDPHIFPPKVWHMRRRFKRNQYGMARRQGVCNNFG